MAQTSVQDQAIGRGNDRDRAHFLLLNIGHYLDHLFTLIFASAAVFALTREWGIPYAGLIPYAMPGFVAFGNCSDEDESGIFGAGDAPSDCRSDGCAFCCWPAAGSGAGPWPRIA